MMPMMRANCEYDLEAMNIVEVLLEEFSQEENDEEEKRKRKQF